jgi:hypothetical protein
VDQQRNTNQALSGLLSFICDAHASRRVRRVAAYSPSGSCGLRPPGRRRQKAALPEKTSTHPLESGEEGPILILVSTLDPDSTNPLVHRVAECGDLELIAPPLLVLAQHDLPATSKLGVMAAVDFPLQQIAEVTDLRVACATTGWQTAPAGRSGARHRWATPYVTCARTPTRGLYGDAPGDAQLLPAAPGPGRGQDPLGVANRRPQAEPESCSSTIVALVRRGRIA